MGIVINVWVHVAGPRVEEYCGPFGDNHSFIFDITLSSAGKSKAEHCEESQNFPSEGCNVRDAGFLTGISPDF